ncbi:phage protease [Zavarzinia aquatilis]|uniref:Mu-like prophage I protein n=1 Tax=Zavarzinia aquatilis TaxID=2211142 RepID=A0A317DSK8_9PROT|nr:phage protease [Zavarzinia aquatilis]PWR17641.1 hypothetical protein DKG74_20755 [Zavarzinia aquatilis]
MPIALASSIALPAEPPAEVQLLPPAGKPFSTDDGRGPFVVIDGAALVAASLTGRDLPVDFDHSIDVQGGGAAAGWITGIEARADGIWGHVDWTERGRAALASRDYRFLSPVFLHRADGAIGRVLRAALTNNPALPQLKALAHRLSFDAEDLMPDFLKALLAALGLSETTTTDQVVAVVTAQRAALEGISTALCARKDASAAEIIAAAKPAKSGDQATIDSLQIELASLRGELAKDKATGAVDAAITKGLIAPAQRDWAIGYASRQPSEFAAFLEKQPALLSSQGGAGARHPGGDALSDADKLVCASMGLTEEAFLAARKKEAN